MPWCPAVSCLATWAVPLMVGRPVAGLSGWGAAATASVAALVSVVSFSASSVKATSTLMVLPSSPATRV